MPGFVAIAWFLHDLAVAPHKDAWEVLETIPPLLKLGPDVLRVRLMICAGLERWEMGQEIARVVGPPGLPTHGIRQLKLVGA